MASMDDRELEERRGGEEPEDQGADGAGTDASKHAREQRGFAAMSPEKQREIASKGGRAAHQKGTAHEWTSEEARQAGRKGGQVSRGGRGRLIASAETPGAEATIPGGEG